MILLFLSYVFNIQKSNELMGLMRESNIHPKIIYIHTGCVHYFNYSMYFNFICTYTPSLYKIFGQHQNEHVHCIVKCRHILNFHFMQNN